MKPNKKWSDIFGKICVCAIFAGCAVGLDGGPTWWNLFCLAVAGASGWLSYKMEVRSNG